ncbi:MAG: hypothetical protein IH609_18080, partial [Dehalococcoidia bacterium]|nr:hypothetical protein [Dehalococcoidia bacterium]
MVKVVFAGAVTPVRGDFADRPLPGGRGMIDNTAAVGEYDHFGKFLDDYMGEDFRARYETHKGAGRAFRVEASAEDVAAVLAELETFLAWAETVPTRTWQAELSALGGRWKPRSVGPLRGLV